MAAKDQPGKSTKMVWRTCLKCSTRLSELCYDTHTLCETCRNKVCDLNSFCEECESWTPEFRKLYLRNRRTLYLKRVSKRNAKSKVKSPSEVDDNASTASKESRVSPPMVILPLDPQLVDSELNLAELGNIQTVDNIVEVQFQPVSTTPPPLPPATVPFNASLMNSAFEKLNNMIEVFREFIPPPREHVGSARRSPSAGPSDIDRPNPLAKVSDMAPQSPDLAPGPSTATYDPHGLGSSRYDAPRDDMFVSPRGGVDRGEHVPYGSRHVSPSTTPSHQERLRDELERIHTEISQIKECNDFCRARGRAPPDHSYRDLEILQSKYAQLSLALEESLQDSSSGHRGRSPFFTSHRVVSPSDAPHPHRGRSPFFISHRSVSPSDAPHPRRPDSSSLQRPRLSPRPRSSSQDRLRSRDAYSGHHHHSRRSQERYQDRFASSAAPSHSRRPRSRGSPSPKRLEFSSRVSPSPQRMGFASRESPSQQRMGFASRGSPSPKRMGFASDAGPSCSKRPRSRDSPSPRPRSSRDSLSPRGFASSPKRMGFASGGSPSPKRQRFESRDSSSPRRQHSSRASSREASVERPQSRSSPTHPSSPSREDKEAEDTSMPAPVKAMIDFILKSFPEATASPAHPSSKSFDLSASAGVTDAATPSGSLLAWCHAMSDAFSDTQKRFSSVSRMEGFAIPYYLLSTDSREYPIRLLKEKS